MKQHEFAGPLSRAVPAALIAVASAWPVAAGAQGLEEIVVTAERRETSLQDTPISVMAFSMETMEMKGVSDLLDLATITPNLDIKGSRGTGNGIPTYQIRGVSGGSGSLGGASVTGERGVGFYIDDVFMPRTTGPVMRTLDLERIEVLRGPQGTLFGRNSVGGAIRVFTQQPGPDQEGYLKVTGGNFDHYDVSGMVNLPVTDNFFVRAQAAWLNQDGYVKRGTQNLGGSEDIIGKLRAAWDVTDRLSIKAGVMYTESESDGSPQDMTEFFMNPVCPTNAAVTTICFEGNYADWMSDFLQAAGQPRLSHNDPRLLLDDYTMPDFCFVDDANPDWDPACEQRNDNQFLQIDAHLTWTINDNLSLKSVTAYTDYSSDAISDWQLLGMERRPISVDSKTFYQELQFNAALFDGRVDLVFGANYFHEKAEAPRDTVQTAFGSSDFMTQMANGNLYGCPTATPCTPSLRTTADYSVEQEADAWGVFANGTWHVNERFDLTGGVRWSDDSKDASYRQYPAVGLTMPPAGFIDASGGDSWDELDWRVTGDFNLSDDIMMYATASKAFRSGTFSFVQRTPAQNGTPFTDVVVVGVPPEKLKNYETGVRTEWFNNRLRFNATMFYMYYTDRQAATQVADATAATGFVIRVVNQGDVDLRGFEIDGQWAVTDNFTIDGSAGWMEYKVVEPCVGGGWYLFPPPTERGFQVGGRYVQDFGSGSVTVGLNYAWVGPQHTHFGGMTPAQFATNNCPAASAGTVIGSLDSRYKLDGYGLLNGIIRYDSGDGRWSASLYGNNITDETYGNFAQSFGGGYWDAGGPPGIVGLAAPIRRAVAHVRGRPFEWGVTLQYNFFK